MHLTRMLRDALAETAAMQAEDELREQLLEMLDEDEDIRAAVRDLAASGAASPRKRTAEPARRR